MQSAHEQLSEHFETLRDGRGECPVYFLEHGLNPSEIEDLVGIVSSSCTAHAISSHVWRFQYFPLLIVATEVGYTYRGPGKDFWPNLEQRLATTITFGDRRALSVLFSEAAKRFGGVARPETPWAINFPHIAWPITHALLPREFHRLFAQTLAELPQQHMDVTQDDALVSAVRHAGRNYGGERFRALLADRNLVVALTRPFLGIDADNVPLTLDALARIKHDLHKDGIAARDIKLARRLRKRAEIRNATRKKGVVCQETNNDIVKRTGVLYLRHRKPKEIHMEVVLPAFPPDIVVRARETLRRRRFAPKLWGVSSRVPSDQILAGLPFAVGGVKSLADLPEPLLPELESLTIDPAVKAELEQYHVDLSPPLLFLEGASKSVARQVRGGIVTVGRTYWLLVSSATITTAMSVRVIGRLGDMSCIRIDPEDETDRAFLERTGIAIRFGTYVQWVGDPPAHEDAEIPDYRVGDAIVLQAKRVPPDGASLVQKESGTRATVKSSDLVSLSNGAGARVLDLMAEGHTDQIRYTVNSETPTQELCWINLENGEPSLDSLLGRACVLRIGGLTSIGGLRLTVSLTGDDISVSCSKRLPPLPAIVGPTDPIWDRLLTERTRDLLRTRAAIQLRAVVGGLAAEEWHLERRLRPCWWEGDGDDRRLVTETDEVAFGVVSPLQPTAEPDCSQAKSGAEGRLFVPTSAGAASLGPTGEFAGLFVAPSKIELRLPPLDRPRLLRSSGSHNRGLGTQQLTTAMLRWRLADAEGPLAEIRRRQIAAELEQWLVRSVCGDVWADVEDSIDAPHPSQWVGFVVQCKHASVGYDSYVELTPTEELAFREIAAQQLQIAVPEIWLNSLGARWSDDLYDRLDAAFLRAYEILAEHHRAAMRSERAAEIDEADPGSAPERWDEVVLNAQSSVELRSLADLVYPTTGGDDLVTLDYSRMTLDDLTDELADWCRRHQGALQGRLWVPAELKAALSLWLDPERVPYMPWRTAVDRFITDQYTSRAVRYVALRRRASLASLSVMPDTR